MSEHKHNDMTAGIVTSNSHSRKLPRKMILKIAVLVLVVGLAAGGYVLVQSRADNKAKHTTKTAENAPKTPEQEVKDAEAAQIAKLQGLIKSETDAKKKTDYQSQLALIYSGQSNYGEAIKLSQTVEKSAASANSAGALGDLYYEKGDYAQAAKYYDLAMQRSPKPASATERSPYNEYANLKKEAEALQK